MIDPEENNISAVQPVANNDSKNTEEVNPIMDCEEHEREDGDGKKDERPPIILSPYDEDFYDESDDEEPQEWTSPPPSPIPPYGKPYDDEYEEDGVGEEDDDIVYDLDNVAINQSNAEIKNEVHLLGVYKCVYLMPKDEQEAVKKNEQEVAEKNEQEAAIIGEDAQKY